MFKSIAISSACLLAVSTAAADVKSSRRVSHYAFEASNLSEANGRMFAASPVRDAEGRSRAGQSRTDISWQVYYKTRPGHCEVDRADITLITTMALPRWRNVDQANEAARAEWARFYGALETHETGHAERSEATVRELERDLLALPPAPDCDTLAQAADNRAHQWSDVQTVSNLAYDAETDFGRKQGVELRSWIGMNRQDVIAAVQPPIVEAAAPGFADVAESAFVADASSFTPVYSAPQVAPAQPEPATSEPVPEPQLRRGKWLRPAEPDAIPN